MSATRRFDALTRIASDAPETKITSFRINCFSSISSQLWFRETLKGENEVSSNPMRTVYKFGRPISAC